MKDHCNCWNLHLILWLVEGSNIKNRESLLQYAQDPFYMISHHGMTVIKQLLVVLWSTVTMSPLLQVVPHTSV
jgi:hypothetical protein